MEGSTNPITAFSVQYPNIFIATKKLIITNQSLTAEHIHLTSSFGSMAYAV